MRDPDRIDLDRRLLRLGRQWFAEARRQSALDDQDVRLWVRNRKSCDASGGSDGDASDGADDGCGDGGGEGGD